MRQRRQTYVVKVTHSYVVDPEGVERGLEVWASFLADRPRQTAKPGKGLTRSTAS
jgi:hypothetical protein